MLLEVVEHCFCFVVRCLVPWVGGIIISPDNFYDCLAELIDALLESAVHQGYLCRYFLRVERIIVDRVLNRLCEFLFVHLLRFLE